MKETDIIEKIRIKIDEKEVLRYLGYPKDINCESLLNIKQVIKKEIGFTYSLLNCRGIYQFIKIKSISDDGLVFTSQDFYFSVNRKILDILHNAEYLMLAVVTIGSELEDSIQEKFRKNQFSEAVVVDALGTVAVKTAGQWLNHFIEQTYLQDGLRFTRYFEPGSGDWGLKEQKTIFKVLRPQKIGVTLNSSFMMYPAKSLSWVRGAGHNLFDSYRDEFSCEYCLLENCRFRKK